ncbi:MAG: LysM peptidoglycan-binding domain-containing protein [Oscillospiraceae bacterium]|nr:LysM peptidoglycan-binding domain-containing protein [Oscillospiraceae bacterium]
MVIHIVEEGESLYAIARRYSLPVSRLVAENGLGRDTRLTPGQALVIQFPHEMYTVRKGDTLLRIARQWGVTVRELLRNNPALSAGTAFTAGAGPQLQPGQQLAVSYTGSKIGPLTVDGYVKSAIPPALLRRSLPYLTTLTVFTCTFTGDGCLHCPDDGTVLDLAHEYGVQPLLSLSTLTPNGSFSAEPAQKLLADIAAQTKLITDLIRTMHRKGYGGLDINFACIGPDYRDAYADFIGRVTRTMNTVGYSVTVSIPAKGLYENQGCSRLRYGADNIMLMSYDWGCSGGGPAAAAPLDQAERIIRYAAGQTEPSRLLLGVPNYGYDWTLPDGRGRAVSNRQAVQQAVDAGVPIRFDAAAATPFFRYYDRAKRQHEVWFEDPRSIQARLELVPQYHLRGISVWNLMNFDTPGWMTLNAMFDVV